MLKFAGEERSHIVSELSQGAREWDPFESRRRRTDRRRLEISVATLKTMEPTCNPIMRRTSVGIFSKALKDVGVVRLCCMTAAGSSRDSVSMAARSAMFSCSERWKGEMKNTRLNAR